MSMTDWAKKEVEIACKREREASNTPEDEWDYGAACYESALKAFNSLMEDGHSGMSIGITKHILNRLIDEEPLTPITEEDFYLTESSFRDDPEYLKKCGLKSRIQCPRMTSLFKDEYLDGTVKYKDVHRTVCIEKYSPNVPYYNGFISNIIDELYPITMPYMPSEKPYEVCTEEILTDRKNGDYDSFAILYIIKPDGTQVDVCRYFKETDTSFTEITVDEWLNRVRLHEERIEKEKENGEC